MSKRGNRKRAAARAIRHMQVEQRRRSRGFRLSAFAAAGLLAVAIGAYAIYMGTKEPASRIPTVANAAGTGIAAGTGPVKVDLYLDYLCPSCQAFHQASHETLENMVQDSKITLTTYPIAILDRYSTNRYSTRSAAAAGCAADAGRFAQFSDLLFGRQPAEGGAGHTDDQLVAIGREAGLGDNFGTCVSQGTYWAWPRFTTEESARRGVNGTPTIFVNDRRVSPAQGQTIADAVYQAIAAAG